MKGNTMETLLHENEFYLSNYGTDKNIEISKDYEEAKKMSMDGNVHIAMLNPKRYYFEDCIDSWNYEDKSDLLMSTPILVWGINAHNQIVKEHDKLICNKGMRDEHITHVEKNGENWHREKDYEQGLVFNSYLFIVGTKIKIFNEDLKIDKIDTIVSNDGKTIMTESHISIDAIKMVTLNTGKLQYADVACYDEIMMGA